MKYAAIYCRVSTQEQKNFGISIDAQKNALIKYCEENNYKYRIFVDEGVSASSMKRPSLQRMLNKISEFDIVLFTKLDRLSRNVLDANTINGLLIKNNVSMKAIDEDDVDTSNADGMFMFNLRVSLAQREIGKTSERIKYVFEYKREKGEVTSGSKKYGYDIVDKHFVVNEAEAQNVVEFYRYYISVGADTNLSYEYYKKHFPYKGYINYRRMLSDTAYIGTYKLFNKDVYLKDYIPRIINDELFYSVQDLLSKKRRIVKNSKEAPITLFDGILKCGECKCSMSRKIQYNTYKENNKTYVNYRCWKSEKLLENGCNNKRSIGENILEKKLLENIEEEAKKCIIKNTTIKELPKKIEKDNSKIIIKKLEKLKDLYIDDLIDKSTYKKDYCELTKELEVIESEKKKKCLEEKKDYSNLIKLINSDFKNIYAGLDKIDKRRFWIETIDKLYLNNGEIEKIDFK